MTAATFPKVEKGKWKYTVTRLLYDTRSLVLLKRRSAKLEMCTAIINKPKKKKKLWIINVPIKETVIKDTQ